MSEATATPNVWKNGKVVFHDEAHLRQFVASLTEGETPADGNVRADDKGFSEAQIAQIATIVATAIAETQPKAEQAEEQDAPEPKAQEEPKLKRWSETEFPTADPHNDVHGETVTVEWLKGKAGHEVTKSVTYVPGLISGNGVPRKLVDVRANRSVNCVDCNTKRTGKSQYCKAHKKTSFARWKVYMATGSWDDAPEKVS